MNLNALLQLVTKACRLSKTLKTDVTRVTAPASAPHYIQQLLSSQNMHVARSLATVRIARIKKFELRILNTTIILYLYQGTHCGSINIQALCAVLKLYVIILESHAHRDKIELHILPTTFKKRFNTTEMVPLNAEHINSGMTDFRSNYIIVYRKEELYKVLLHELIHYYRYDFFDSLTPANAEAQIKLMFNVTTSRLAVNEAHTETLTELIYAAIYTYHNSTVTQTAYVRYLQTLDRIRMYAVNRLRVIHAYYDKQFRGRIVEDTHVCSYFFIKTLLLCRLPEYLKLIGSTMKINEPVDIEAFMTLILRCKDVYTQVIAKTEPLKIHESLRMMNIDVVFKKVDLKKT